MINTQYGVNFTEKPLLVGLKNFLFCSGEQEYENQTCAIRFKTNVICVQISAIRRLRNDLEFRNRRYYEIPKTEQKLGQNSKQFCVCSQYTNGFRYVLDVATVMLLYYRKGLSTKVDLPSAFRIRLCYIVYAKKFTLSVNLLVTLSRLQAI